MDIVAEIHQPQVEELRGGLIIVFKFTEAPCFQK